MRSTRASLAILTRPDNHLSNKLRKSGLAPVLMEAAAHLPLRSDFEGQVIIFIQFHTRYLLLVDVASDVYALFFKNFYQKHSPYYCFWVWCWCGGGVSIVEHAYGIQNGTYYRTR